MNVEQTAHVLGLAAAYDRRTIGDAEIVAWHAALGDLDADDAKAAVVAHYGNTGEWLMPAHVRQLVQEIRRDRQRAEQRDRDREAGLIRQVGALDRVPAQPIEAALHDRSAEVVALVTALRDKLAGYTSRPHDALWSTPKRCGSPARIIQDPGLVNHPSTTDPPPRAAARTGLGFCVTCYDHGQIVVATDPEHGSACNRHEREAVAS